MLQISPVSSNSDVPNVFTREFGIDPLDNELKPDEGRKTLISLTFLLNKVHTSSWVWKKNPLYLWHSDHSHYSMNFWMVFIKILLIEEIINVWVRTTSHVKILSCEFSLNLELLVLIGVWYCCTFFSEVWVYCAVYVLLFLCGFFNMP